MGLRPKQETLHQLTDQLASSAAEGGTRTGTHPKGPTGLRFTKLKSSNGQLPCQLVAFAATARPVGSVVRRPDLSRYPTTVAHGITLSTTPISRISA